MSINKSKIKRSFNSTFLFILLILLVASILIFLQKQDTSISKKFAVSTEDQGNLPILIDNRMVSPLVTTALINGNKKIIQQITWETLPGWTFADYEFNTCRVEGTVCEYKTTIANSQNKAYKLRFWLGDAGVGPCTFDGSVQDVGHGVSTDGYSMTSTSFGGELRLVRLNDTSSAFCQSNVETYAGINSGWLGITNIGFIQLEYPRNPNRQLIDEMVEMVEMVERETF